MTDEPAQPTSEDVDKGKAVAGAMVQAGAEAAPEERQEAMQEAGAREAERQNLPMSEDDLKKLATMLGPIVTNGVLEGMDLRGVFEGDPEPVQPAPRADPAPGPEQTAAAAAAAPSEPQTPRKRTLAERFAGQ